MSTPRLAKQLHLRLVAVHGVLIKPAWTPRRRKVGKLYRATLEAEMWPGANTLPWEDDPVARALVAEHGPFTLEEVGAFLGINRERVRQIEEEALAKFKAGMMREMAKGEV